MSIHSFRDPSEVDSRDYAWNAQFYGDRSATPSTMSLSEQYGLSNILLQSENESREDIASIGQESDNSLQYMCSRIVYRHKIKVFDKLYAEATEIRRKYPMDDRLFPKPPVVKEIQDPSQRLGNYGPDTPLTKDVTILDEKTYAVILKRIDFYIEKAVEVPVNLEYLVALNLQLQMQPVWWIDEFAERNGVESLLTALRNLGHIPERHANTEAEVLLIQSLFHSLNSNIARNHLYLSAKCAVPGFNAIGTLAESMFSKNLNARRISTFILKAICSRKFEHGQSSVVKALEWLVEKGASKTRFSRWMTALHDVVSGIQGYADNLILPTNELASLQGTDCLIDYLVVTFNLIRGICSCTIDLHSRCNIRREFLNAGLGKTLEIMQRWKNISVRTVVVNLLNEHNSDAQSYRKFIIANSANEEKSEVASLKPTNVNQGQLPEDTPQQAQMLNAFQKICSRLIDHESQTSFYNLLQSLGNEKDLEKIDKSMHLLVFTLNAIDEYKSARIDSNVGFNIVSQRLLDRMGTADELSDYKTRQSELLLENKRLHDQVDALLSQLNVGPRDPMQFLKSQLNELRKEIDQRERLLASMQREFDGRYKAQLQAYSKLQSQLEAAQTAGKTNLYDGYPSGRPLYKRSSSQDSLDAMSKEFAYSVVPTLEDSEHYITPENDEQESETESEISSLEESNEATLQQNDIPSLAQPALAPTTQLGPSPPPPPPPPPVPTMGVSKVVVPPATAGPPPPPAPPSAAGGLPPPPPPPPPGVTPGGRFVATAPVQTSPADTKEGTVKTEEELKEEEEKARQQREEAERRAREAVEKYTKIPSFRDYYEPKNQLKRVHWERVEPPSGSNIFVKFPIDLETIGRTLLNSGWLQILDEKFDNTRRIETKAISKEATTTSLLSPNVKQHLEIVLRSVSDFTPEQLVRMFLTDPNFLPPAIQFFHKSGFATQEGLLSPFASYWTDYSKPEDKRTPPKDDVNELGYYERFFVLFIVNLRHYFQQRMYGLRLRETFIPELENIEAHVRKVIDVCRSILEDEYFSGFFQVLLNLGNYINDPLDKARAFSLPMVYRLETLRDCTFSNTLLHYFEDIIRTQFPEYEKSEATFKKIQSISSYGIDGLVSEMESAYEHFLHFKNEIEKGALSKREEHHPEDKVIDAIYEWYQKASEKIKGFMALKRDFLQLTEDTVKYLCEFKDVEVVRNTFLKNLTSFYIIYCNVRNDNARKREREAQARRTEESKRLIMERKKTSIVAQYRKELPGQTNELVSNQDLNTDIGSSRAIDSSETLADETPQLSDDADQELHDTLLSELGKQISEGAGKESINEDSVSELGSAAKDEDVIELTSEADDIATKAKSMLLKMKNSEKTGTNVKIDPMNTDEDFLRAQLKAANHPQKISLPQNKKKESVEASLAKSILANLTNPSAKELQS